MNTINARIEAVRKKMLENNISIYIVPTNDYHSSEYIGDYFKTREYITGFTGSAGTAVITKDKAILWTDGRYYIQAEKELYGSEVLLYKAGMEGVPSVAEFISGEVSVGDIVGIDGKCTNDGYISTLGKKLEEKKASVKLDIDIVGSIWNDRPKLASNEIYELDVQYTGEKRYSKLMRVGEYMYEKGCEYFVLTSLDDIAWLLNLRGDDIQCNPVFFSYFIKTRSEGFLYVLEGAVSDEIKQKLEKDNIRIKKYEDFYNALSAIDRNESVLLDRNLVNALVTEKLKGCNIVDDINPTLIMKATKNSTEVDNVRKAHIKDGVAVTKFIYWLKNTMKDMEVTEYEAATYLENLRKQNENYIGASFEPIVAYGENAAMCHYSPKITSSAIIKRDSYLLIDTGGHYLEGTTDITRTVMLGKASDEEKLHYTLVLKGNLKLGAAKFTYGCKGQNLDYLARESLWERGLDYNHGTGNGVGYLLNVHEGPNSIRSIISNVKNPDAEILREGMITSNEPGIYLEGKYGIRLENLIVCKKLEKTEYGQFMGFETLTLVPFDMDAIDLNLLTDREISILRDYHKRVYETLEIYLSDEEKNWLYTLCNF